MCADQMEPVLPPLYGEGKPVRVRVSTLPSAATNAIVFHVGSPMVLPAVTCQHCKASAVPSAVRDGQPDTSCHTNGNDDGAPAVLRVHASSGSAMVSSTAPVVVETSSIYTGRARLSVAAGAGFVPSPTRTTRTEPLA